MKLEMRIVKMHPHHKPPCPSCGEPMERNASTSKPKTSCFLGIEIHKKECKMGDVPAGFDPSSRKYIAYKKHPIYAGICKKYSKILDRTREIMAVIGSWGLRDAIAQYMREYPEMYGDKTIDTVINLRPFHEKLTKGNKEHADKIITQVFGLDATPKTCINCNHTYPTYEFKTDDGRPGSYCLSCANDTSKLRPRKEKSAE